MLDLGLGRFTQRDPELGNAGNEHYVYAQNDPGGKSDRATQLGVGSATMRCSRTAFSWAGLEALLMRMTPTAITSSTKTSWSSPAQ